MITERERYLLERCLRLEARIAALEGHRVAPLPPADARVSRRPLRDATAAEIAQMRTLKQRGLSYAAIGRRVGFSDQTARRHVLREREVGS